MPAHPPHTFRHGCMLRSTSQLSLFPTTILAKAVVPLRHALKPWDTGGADSRDDAPRTCKQAVNITGTGQGRVAFLGCFSRQCAKRSISCLAAGSSASEPSSLQLASNTSSTSLEAEMATKMKAGSMTMILLAFEGAGSEIAAGKTLKERCGLFAKLTLFLLLEIVGIIRLIPYGIRAMWTYKSLGILKASVQRRATEEFLSLQWKMKTIPAVLKDKGFRLGFGRDSERQAEEGQCGEHAESSQQADILNEAELGNGQTRGEGGGVKATSKESSLWWGRWILGTSKFKASVLRDISYGVGARNTMDIYVPWNPVRRGQVPVVLFVHGGVWASGEKWQYAPLGAQLAHEGVISVLMQYTLFPDVLATEQAQEVSAALLWVMDHISDYGGDPSRIFLMGHSSGAHICAMAMWQRVQTRLRGMPTEVASAAEQESGITAGTASAAAQKWESATCQPYCFIGLSGVYDVGVHYRYEQSRGAAAVSALRRAMGGADNFPQLSPALLFPTLKSDLPTQPLCESTKSIATQADSHISSDFVPDARDLASPRVPPPLPSQAPPNMITSQLTASAKQRHGSKFHRPGLAIAATSAALSSTLQPLESAAGTRAPTDNAALNERQGLLARRPLALREEIPSIGTSSLTLLSRWFASHVGSSKETVKRQLRDGSAEGSDMVEAEGDGFVGDVPRGQLFCGESAARLKRDHQHDLVAPSILMCSPEDFVVPPTTSVQMLHALTGIGCRAKVVSYDGVTHGDFIIWKEKRGQNRGRSNAQGQALGEHVTDIFDIVCENVSLDDLEWGV